MRRPLLLGALAAAMVLTAAADTSSAQRRSQGIRGDGPDRRDWLRTTMRTPEGGYRIGNPNAATKLVEYVSLSCDHCAAFARQAADRLFQQYVRNGQISVEYRLYSRNGVDIAAGMLVNCLAPARHFEMVHNLLGSQPQWLGRIRGVTAQQQQELAALPPLQVAQRLVSMLGLDEVARRHGLDAAAQQRCMSQAGLERIEQARQEADRLGVIGTPTFFINGQRVGPTDWAGLEPLLRGR